MVLDKFKNFCDEDTIIITDTSIAISEKKKCTKIWHFSLYRKKFLEDSQSINILCLGILAALTKDIDYENLEKAICDNVPKSSIRKEFISFNTGINMVFTSWFKI